MRIRSPEPYGVAPVEDDRRDGGPAGDGRQAAKPDASFEARLAAARGRQGMDPKPASTGGMGGGASSSLGVGLRVGVEMVSALVVALAIGWYLDRWLHTTPLFLVVFVILGGAAGVANVWRVVGPKKSG